MGLERALCVIDGQRLVIQKQVDAVLLNLISSAVDEGVTVR
ncbi:MAG: hypothetical protein ACWGNK_11175 [Desulfobacterales bacterium]